LISRYNHTEVADCWKPETKFHFFLEVELALLDELSQIKKDIPRNICDLIRKKVKINIDRIDEIEKVVQHDVIAFCQSITEQLPPDIGRWFHYGVTSSDVIDSALSLQIKKSLEIILGEFDHFFNSFKELIKKSEDTLTMGRTHGMQAEPMLLASKWLSYYSEFKRRYDDYKKILQEELTLQLSGAVGNYSLIPPLIEEKVAAHFKLKTEAVSTQIIPRDHLAKIIQTGSLFSVAVERFVTEIRHLQRSEVLEAAEGFKIGQKGSSTMPHKKNPITSENLTGLSRVIRSHGQIALENCVTWHERDISHSSTERLYLPDHFILIGTCLKRLNNLVSELVLFKDTMKQRVRSHQHALSSFYLHQLLHLTTASREEIYEVVQKASFSFSPADFKNELETHFKVTLPNIDYNFLFLIYQKNYQSQLARLGGLK